MIKRSKKTSTSFWNLSSWQIHCQEALQISLDYNVDVAVIIETRIRDNSKSAHYEAAAEGYNGFFSEARQINQNNCGSKEGGVAIFINDGYVTPSLGNNLDGDFALHTAVPLPWAKSPLLHIIGAYISQNNKQQITHILEYAATLGDEPIVIVADWNVEMDQCQEFVQAKLTGTWIEVAERFASEGNKYAEALMNRSSTHRTNTYGLRVDYMFVNKQSHSMIGDVEMLESQPLVNHYPLIFTLKISKTKAVDA